MPTGFTASVADGKVTNLRTFALQCARGMGALITMRDEPWDKPVPTRLEPNTRYYDEKLVGLRAELAAIETMTNADVEARMMIERKAALAYNAESVERVDAERRRYDAMIEQVTAWSTEAEGIREFMLEQLQRGKEFDCPERVYEHPLPEIVDVAVWRDAHRRRLAEQIGRCEQSIAEEVGRTAERNRWLTALFASLPPEEQR